MDKNHVHKYEHGRSMAIVTCYCGSWRHTCECCGELPEVCACLGPALNGKVIEEVK